MSNGTAAVTGMNGLLTILRSSVTDGETDPADGEIVGTEGVAPSLDPDSVGIDMRLAQLLCSRLCHDLAGSSGAIHNGIELMGDGAGADPAALSLVAASAAHLNNRLAFYRVAFGLGGGERTMTLDDARTLARDGITSQRVELDWRIEPGDEAETMRSVSIDGVRLALVLVLIGADALPRGGTLRVRYSHTAEGVAIGVTAKGSRAGLAGSLLAAMDLEAAASSLTPRTVHGYFAVALARRLGAGVDVRRNGADEIVLTVSPRRRRRTGPIPFPAVRSG